MLEDRSLPSAGGLLSVLAPPSQPSARPPSSASGLTGVLDTTTSLLAPVTTAVSDVAAPVLGGSATPTAGAPSAGGLGLHVDLGVDLLFVHLDDVRLDVAVAPAATDQPLLSLGVGSTAGVGPQTGGLFNVAPNVTVGAGGDGLMSMGLGAPGQVMGVPVPPVVSSGTTLTPALPVLPDAPTPPASPAGGQIALPVVGVASPPASIGSGGQNAAPPAAVSGPAASSEAPQAPAAANPALANGAGDAAPAVPERQAPESAPADAALVLVQNEADGAGGAAGPATPVVQTIPVVPRAEDGGGAPATPAFQAPDGGHEVIILPAPETSGLAMGFQPFGLGRFHRAFGDMLARVAPAHGWLTALLARLPRWAPWLGGCLVAAVVFDVRRRRRRVARPARTPVAG